jgi:hypothetical protein
MNFFVIHILKKIQSTVFYEYFSAPTDFGDNVRYVHILGWVDIGTRAEVPLKLVTYLSKITKINEKSVLTQ